MAASPWLRINPLTTIVGDTPQEMMDASLVLGLFAHRPVATRRLILFPCQYAVAAMDDDGEPSTDPEEQGIATFLVGLN